MDLTAGPVSYGPRTSGEGLVWESLPRVTDVHRRRPAALVVLLVGLLRRAGKGGGGIARSGHAHERRACVISFCAGIKAAQSRHTHVWLFVVHTRTTLTAGVRASLRAADGPRTRGGVLLGQSHSRIYSPDVRGTQLQYTRGGVYDLSARGGVYDLSARGGVHGLHTRGGVYGWCTRGGVSGHVCLRFRHWR